MKHETNLPVAVIGAGPVGLAAAAHLLERGETPLVLEAGAAAGVAVRQWAHVRLFSPWRYLVDSASRRLLERSGWRAPDPQALPTGAELLARYIEPLASQPALRERIRYGERVVAVSRAGADKVKSANRARRPFVIQTLAADGARREHRARAVIDASGTWETPNAMGGDGLRPLGEEAARGRIDYGIPDAAGARRADFAGAATLVVGSGHSSINAVLALLALKEEAPDTRVLWAIRRASLDHLFGGGAADALPERGALGQRAKAAIESGALEVLAPFAIRSLARAASGQIVVAGEQAGEERSVVVDRIVVVTGFRPELDMLRETRLDLDPALECPRALGPLIDPNIHSCGTVRPHGARELAHPEPHFYIVGMKSYGRAPTFLLATGYEQVRSVAAKLSGDHKAAARVELDLPETGVCGLPGADDSGNANSCCGGPPSKNAEACCALDESKKAAGETGCGCGARSRFSKRRRPSLIKLK